MEEKQSARSQLLDLACEVALYRVLGGSFYPLIERAADVARVAAGEGVPMRTPMSCQHRAIAIGVMVT